MEAWPTLLDTIPAFGPPQGQLWGQDHTSTVVWSFGGNKPYKCNFLVNNVLKVPKLPVLGAPSPRFTHFGLKGGSWNEV